MNARLEKFKNGFTTALSNRPLQIVLIVITVLLLVYFYGKKAGKDTTVTVPYPNTKGTDDLSSDFTSKIAPNIINAMFEAFDGWGAVVQPKLVAIIPLLSLTDNQLIYIFNTYNNRYLRGKNQSLYTVIDSEYFGLVGDGVTDKAEVLRKMRTLGMDKLLV